MKLYQLFRQIKGTTGINGTAWQLGVESFIEVANTALMYVGTYLGRKRSRQLTTQSITNYDLDDSGIYYYKTMFPIVNGSSVKFFCWEKEEIQKVDDCEYTCSCVDHIDISCCECECRNPKDLEMTYVDPGKPLEQWEFTIIWWTFRWGNLGNKIKAKFPCTDCFCQEGTVFISYYAGTRLFSCINDDIPFPPEYIEGFKLILKGLLSTNIWNGQSNRETLWFTFAKEIIEGLDYNENNIPWRIEGKRTP